jgi:hypothetical protein
MAKATHSGSPRSRRWLGHVVTTLISVAFLVVMALVSLFGDKLVSLPLV